MKRISRQRYFGFLTGMLFDFFSKRPPQINLIDRDFPTSTQRMGVRFSERIRHFFRYRWFSAKH